MIDSRPNRAGIGLAAFFLACFCAVSIFAQTNPPRFNVIAFYTGKSDKAHISFVREANRWFPKMAAEHGFAYDATDNWENLNPGFLAKYQVVLFLDTRPDAPAQREAFQKYIENGGGWMGFHFAAFALTPSQFPQNWDWYHNEFLGAGSYAGNTWRPTSAILKVEDVLHPAMKGLPETFKASPNEWYKWTSDLRTNRNIRILASIDPASFPLGTGPKQHEIWHSGYYPVVWTNQKYRMIYFNMGHNDLDYENKTDRELSYTFDNEAQNKLILNALEWLGKGKTAPTRDMVLWYRQAAEKWLEASPLGNGFMGAMVFGGIEQERIALNESSFWSGRPHDYDDPEAIKYFPQVRDLVFDVKFQEAEKLADEHFYGKPVAQQAYQPLGDLLLSFDGIEKADDYYRELDLETGVSKVRYRSGDAVFTREAFISYPDRVMVVRLTCDKPGRVAVQAQLKSPYSDSVNAKPGRLVMEGCWKGPITNNWLIAQVEGKGLRFQTSLLALPEGGQSEATDSSLRIRNADAVTFILTAATSFVNYHDISGDPAAVCGKTLTAIAGTDYSMLRRRHEADFRALMSRVHLQVGEAARNSLSIDERLKAVREGNADPNLEALCFQFGRYLLVSSSRAGGQPANLQGIWNDSISPSWGSKYTININTEMNYWPAEVCNLSECHEPLFDLLRDIATTGAKTARAYYGCGGWVAHHNIDLWRGTAPVDAARFGMWPVGGAWLCQHLWEHYAFSGDQRFLKECYPIMKGAAQFLLEVMVEDPSHHWLVTPFSMSPEHGYLDHDGKLAFLSPSPTLDVAIMKELFPHCIAASRVLGVDEDFRGKLEAALKRLPPYQINSRGCLQEWIEDWKPGDQGHNCSPNFTIYPGSSITLRDTPEMASAILKWMDPRHSRGGWPLAWDICVWARLERGDRVADCLQTLVRNSLAPNLHNAGANQSDASFGLTAGVAEALLQSHAGEISLLPALPTDWGDGAVTGLRARGGFDVDIQWQKGKLRSAELRNRNAATCKVRYGARTAELSLQPGQPIHISADLSTLPGSR